jgi:hypothetical protein
MRIREIITRKKVLGKYPKSYADCFYAFLKPGVVPRLPSHAGKGLSPKSVSCGDCYASASDVCAYSFSSAASF